MYNYDISTKGDDMIKTLKPSEKIWVAYANGVRTAGEYAIYLRRNRTPKLRTIATFQGCFNEK